MANINVKGFVSKPTVREGSKGPFVTFTLKEGVKQRDGKYENFFYNVTQFNTAEVVQDNARVEVRGRLQLRNYEAAGQKRVSMDIVADEVTSVDAPKPEPAAVSGDEFDF